MTDEERKVVITFLEEVIQELKNEDCKRDFLCEEVFCLEKYLSISTEK